jgi:hypothetical protein
MQVLHIERRTRFAAQTAIDAFFIIDHGIKPPDIRKLEAYGISRAYRGTGPAVGTHARR